ncbi:putative holin [Mycolicibacterium sediminis]|uniref:Hydrophobic protein n=2 Tax=Mycolicibacterium sediminis TaxID=1286180 RepID=A0A7I7QNJ6_9MYCO|nr:hypothetical protein MSEDJ_19800 [Mycolicibacterium sediminis]
MLIGVAVGMVAGIAASILITAPVRPDVAIALVVGVPIGIGMLMVLFSSRRWVTTFGAFTLSLAPGWFGALAAIQVASGG